MTAMLSYMLTAALSCAAVVAAWLAVQVRAQPAAADLQDLHREIDRLRELAGQAAHRGEDPGTHLERLRAAQAQLPEDDLRR